MHVFLKRHRPKFVSCDGEATTHRSVSDWFIIIATQDVVIVMGRVRVRGAGPDASSTVN